MTKSKTQLPPGAPNYVFSWGYKVGILLLWQIFEGESDRRLLHIRPFTSELIEGIGYAIYFDQHLLWEFSTQYAANKALERLNTAIDLYEIRA